MTQSLSTGHRQIDLNFVPTKIRMKRMKKKTDSKQENSMNFEQSRFSSVKQTRAQTIHHKIERVFLQASQTWLDKCHVPCTNDYI